MKTKPPNDIQNFKPECWNWDEIELLKKGKCPWMTEYGNPGAAKFCKKKLNRGETYCKPHLRDARENGWTG
ncbi:hypothetical protein ABN028_19805 [Actinopolymorpha sp. B17G11]|uniref:hypothetical protein n=1 Tax=Actinopolymorpha sp. B17G11 TaxID=3160861 RepID=UPI0032E43FB5